MKSLVSFLVSLLILLGQAHACQRTYILPNGEDCLKCSSLKDTCRQTSVASLKSALHGDCHDCCKIKPCDNKGKSTAPVVTISPAHLDIDLPMALRQPVPQGLQIAFQIPVFDDGCPATGPPSTRSSRAPPISASSLTFA